MHTSLLLCLSVVCMIVFVPSIFAACPAAWKGASGHTYDLSSLTRPSTTPYYGIEALATQFHFYWNLCENLQGVPSSIGTLQSPTVQLDMNANPPVVTPIGYLTGYTLSETPSGLRFVYANNNDYLCYDNGIPSIPRVTTINVECDNKATTGTVVSIVEPTDNNQKCKYTITMKHSAACKGGGGLSGGSVFLIILLCLSVTYLVGGVIFNKVRNDASGVALIPNVEFWQGLPGLIVDGFRFVKGKFTGGSYSTL